MINAERQTQYHQKRKKRIEKQRKNTNNNNTKIQTKEEKNCCIFYELKSGQTDIKSDKNFFTSSTHRETARCIALLLHCIDTLGRLALLKVYFIRRHICYNC